jgi:hypothetical protein
MPSRCIQLTLAAPDRAVPENSQLEQILKFGLNFAYKLGLVVPESSYFRNFYLVVSYLSEHDGYASLAGSIEICLLVVDYVWYACTGNPTSLHAAKASSSSLELEIPRLNVSSRYL